MSDPIFDEPLKLDAYSLREVAEAASGTRGPDGAPVFLVQTGDQLRLQYGDPGDTPPPGTVIEVDTFSQQPDRPPVTEVCIASGGKTFHLEDRYDAVFWTESAVEKFVFPYYVSKSLWKAARHLTVLSEWWYKGGRRSSPTLAAGEERAIPFAIGHVPDSQFVPLADEGLDLLFRNPDGSVYAVPLAELIAEQEAGSPGTAGPAPRSPASGDGA